jgi:hypothetical protein
VIYGDLQCLHYHLVDMQLSPKIKEVMPEIFSEVWKLDCIALFGPLKQILSDVNNFCRFAHL